MQSLYRFADFVAAVSDSQLEAEIADYDAWPDLVAACRGDEGIARVLMRFIAARPVADWLDTRPPVLQGFSGAECLDTAEGRNRLREALMRFQ